MRRCYLSLSALLLIFTFTTFASAQNKRPITFEDMMSLKRLGDPAVSPDGKWVLFSAVDVSLAENTRKSHLWVVPVGGGPAKAITSGAAGET
ncbi:MAG TPA: hypothetical protein VM056_07210, partial [Terriglobales bacterium]|nr:hypothetical protein [Terriglobales bacterium]